MVQGGRERGVILHKLIEEVLTGELADDLAKLQARASELLAAQLGLPDAEDAADGLSSREMATAVQRTLQLKEITELRPKPLPEFRVYAAYGSRDRRRHSPPASPMRSSMRERKSKRLLTGRATSTQLPRTLRCIGARCAAI